MVDLKYVHNQHHLQDLQMSCLGTLFLYLLAFLVYPTTNIEHVRFCCAIQYEHRFNSELTVSTFVLLAQTIVLIRI